MNIYNLRNSSPSFLSHGSIYVFFGAVGVFAQPGKGNGFIQDRASASDPVVNKASIDTGAGVESFFITFQGNPIFNFSGF